MAEEQGIYTQFAKRFSTLEELKAYKEKVQAEAEEQYKGWVDVGAGVKMPPAQAREYLKNSRPKAPPIAPATVDTAVTPAELVERKKDFATIHQGTSTNALTKLRATEGKNATIDLVTGTATIKAGNLILQIPNYAQLTGLKTSTYQLLDAITIALTESGAKSPTVVLSVEDYMKRRGLKDRKEARKQLTADLDVLLKTSLTWEEKRGKSSVPYAGVNITDSWVWADGKKTAVAYTFGQTFYSVLMGYPVMPYPAQLQTLNAKRNPNSYYLLRKIAEHKNMNIGKKNEDIIAVKTLLESSPYFPSYEEVMSADRHLDQRIIKPFERDMDALGETLTWHYCHSLDQPLTDEELDSLSFDTFKGLLVRTSWRHYPDQTARLERKTERIEQATKKKRTPSKKKKPAEE